MRLVDRQEGKPSLPNATPLSTPPVIAAEPTEDFAEIIRKNKEKRVSDGLAKYDPTLDDLLKDMEDKS